MGLVYSYSTRDDLLVPRQEPATWRDVLPEQCDKHKIAQELRNLTQPPRAKDPPKAP